MKSFLWVVALFISLNSAAQQQIVYNTPNLPKPDTTWVFTPKGSKKTDKLPLIFLLHGYSGSYKQWNSIMDAQKYADEYGFIIVCPDGLFNSWYLDSPDKSMPQYETFFFKELWPDILQKYTPDTQKIFISGLSMGGHGALTLFLKHPQLFKSAGSTSGVTDLRELTSKYGLYAIMNTKDEKHPIWLDASVQGNISKLKGTDKAIIFDCGADDPFYKMNTALKVTTDSLKINATFISQPGAHNRAYWAKSIKQHFEFFKAQLK